MIYIFLSIYQYYKTLCMWFYLFGYILYTRLDRMDNRWFWWYLMTSYLVFVSTYDHIETTPTKPVQSFLIPSLILPELEQFLKDKYKFYPGMWIILYWVKCKIAMCGLQILYFFLLILLCIIFTYAMKKRCKYIFVYFFI